MEELSLFIQRNGLPRRYNSNFILFVMIGATVEDREGSVELFYKDKAHHLMREGHA